MKKIIINMVVVLAFTGCAGMPGMSKDLQKETVRSISDVQPDTIDVHSITHGVTSIKWEAETAKGH